MTLLRCTALLLAFAGCAFDLKTGKIPNALAGAGLLTGLALHLRYVGILGPWPLMYSFLGAAIPLGIGWLLFRFRLFGAGDIKLLAAIGSVTGYRGILWILFWSVLFGAGIAAFIMTFYTGFRERFSAFAAWVKECVERGQAVPYRKEGGAENFHFTVPILMSVMLYAGGLL